MTHHDHHHDPFDSPHPPTSAAHWEDRYAGELVWSGNVNDALAAEAADLTPGRALDVGCGEGADAVWLAQHGWTVTALDIANNAVERTRARAAAAGVEVATVVAPLAEADLEAGSFDLVIAMYPVLPRLPEEGIERRLCDLVAPGGTLLFVHHVMEGEALDQARARGFDPVDFVFPDDVRAALGEEWDIVTDTRRGRHVAEGAGAGHSEDIILRARRR